MCNCQQNEFELIPELEFMSEQPKYKLGRQKGSFDLPEIWDTSQLEYEVPYQKCGGVIDPDDSRFKVSDTTIEPFKYICKIEWKDSNGYLGWCTGTLIKPNKVLTAAHCLFNTKFPIRIIPGKNGPGQSKKEEPFGYTYASRIDIPDEYKFAKGLEAGKPFDYGVITLKEPIGKRVGFWKRIAVKPDQLLLRNKVNTAGYPQDISPDNQIKVYDQNVGVSTENIDFLLDICHGQSGSPIWITWNNNGHSYRVIVGIVTIQNDLYKGTKVNSGVRMSPTVIANIQKWVSR